MSDPRYNRPDPGFYNRLIHAMVEGLDEYAESTKGQIEFWASPSGDDHELAEIARDELRSIEDARKVLVPIEGQMPPGNYYGEGLVTIIARLEQEMRDYRSSLQRLATRLDDAQNMHPKIRAALDLEQALTRARESAEKLKEVK